MDKGRIQVQSRDGDGARDKEERLMEIKSFWSKENGRSRVSAVARNVE